MNIFAGDIFSSVILFVVIVIGAYFLHEMVGDKKPNFQGYLKATSAILFAFIAISLLVSMIVDNITKTINNIIYMFMFIVIIMLASLILSRLSDVVNHMIAPF